MMMSVMIPESIDSYQLTNEFTELGKKIGVEINLRNAKIYDTMHNLLRYTGGIPLNEFTTNL